MWAEKARIMSHGSVHTLLERTQTLTCEELVPHFQEKIIRMEIASSCRVAIWMYCIMMIYKKKLKFSFLILISHLLSPLNLEGHIFLLKILYHRKIIILLLKFYWHIMSVLKFIEKYILLPKFCAVINSLPFR